MTLLVAPLVPVVQPPAAFPLPSTLAAALLLTPPGVPEAAPPVEVWPALRDSIHQIAIDWEIMDPREARYVLTRPEDLCADLNILRRRREDLTGVPRVADGERFPERAAVNELVRFNRAFRKRLDERAAFELDRRAAFEVVMRETDRLYQVWDAVRDSRCDFYYVTVRRQALKKLRALIGDEAYLAGELPPIVPTWRFNDLK